ncbi:hypothetical protein ACFFX1_05105 [Dactylosporangium sucinum]|uniref:Uncharacterized protein n=1 Tax=Dactylosporangium sucinum TaxID=1424081 RepID=A0A917TS94_9ACTN|nr:hypothetical protein [Dactylosporangium sucinum]GGM32652.1 hypothetical protein GCM10007977_037530 [Dactylosporangium sucinum]
MSIGAVSRELLVRCLDNWAPGGLHSAHGATFLLASGSSVDQEAAEAAVRALGEFADRLRGRRLSLLFVAPGVDGLEARLRAVLLEMQTPGDFGVHVVAGTAVDAVLKAVGAGSGPLFAMVDDSVSKNLTAKAADVLVTARVGTWPDQRRELHAHGFELTAGVELIDDAGEVLVAFGTRSGKALEAFKNEMWALDEYAGVRYRDPEDPEGHLMDISLEPNPGALRRELLDVLRGGPMTVTELKRFALTDTVYRAADAQKVVTALLHAGAVTRTPESGRLGGDVVIRLSGG